jgi:hypothetical protein
MPAPEANAASMLVQNVPAALLHVLGATIADRIIVAVKPGLRQTPLKPWAVTCKSPRS